MGALFQRGCGIPVTSMSYMMRVSMLALLQMQGLLHPYSNSTMGIIALAILFP